MRIFLDTSILLPATFSAHPNHADAKLLIKDSATNSAKLLCLSTHVIAELYSSFPSAARHLRVKVTPREIQYAIRAVVEHMEAIILEEDDYYHALDRCAQLELMGPVVYDALHYQAALKAKADTLYTENLRDFERLQLPGDALQIKSLNRA